MSDRKFKSYLVFVVLNLFNFSIAISQPNQCTLTVKTDKAYFHDRNNINGKLSFTPRKAFLVLGDQVAINCQDKNENWIYVSYKNTKGTITRGFIKKADLENAAANDTSGVEYNKKNNQKIEWLGIYAFDTKYSNKTLSISIPNNKGEFEFEIMVASETCSYPYSGRAKLRGNAVASGIVNESDPEYAKITFNYIVSKNMIDVKFDGGFRCSPDGIYKKQLKGIK